MIDHLGFSVSRPGVVITRDRGRTVMCKAGARDQRNNLSIDRAGKVSGGCAQSAAV